MGQQYHGSWVAKVPIRTLWFLEAVSPISPRGLGVSGRVRSENFYSTPSALGTTWGSVCFFSRLIPPVPSDFLHAFCLQVVLMDLLLASWAWRWEFLEGPAAFPGASSLLSCPCFWPFLWQVFGRGPNCWHWSLSLPSDYLRSPWITPVERECINAVL